MTNLGVGLPLAFAVSVTFAREVAEDESDAGGIVLVSSAHAHLAAIITRPHTVMAHICCHVRFLGVFFLSVRACIPGLRSFEPPRSHGSHTLCLGMFFAELLAIEPSTGTIAAGQSQTVSISARPIRIESAVTLHISVVDVNAATDEFRRVCLRRCAVTP